MTSTVNQHGTGRHAIPLTICYDENMGDLYDEWVRDSAYEIEVDHDQTINMNKNSAAFRKACVEQVWRRLEYRSSLAVKRFPNRQLIQDRAEHHHPDEGVGDCEGDNDADGANNNTNGAGEPYLSLMFTESKNEDDGVFEENLEWANGQLSGAFDPRFLIVKTVNEDDNEAFERLLEAGMWYLASDQGKAQLERFLEPSWGGEIELVEFESLTGLSALGFDMKPPDLLSENDAGSIRLCALLNGIASAIIGPGYRKICHWAGYDRLEAAQRYVDPGPENLDDIVFLKSEVDVLKSVKTYLVCASGEGHEHWSMDNSLRGSLARKALQIVSPRGD
jgi:hypothetical protein